MLKSLFCVSLFLFNQLMGVNSITISGNPSGLSITTAVAGQPPTAVQNNSTTYGVTTTASNVSVLGKINSAMPTGVTLKVQLAAPSRATSAGLVTMTKTNQTLVSGIPNATSVSGLTVTYELSATSQAAKVSNATKTLTLTIQ